MVIANRNMQFRITCFDLQFRGGNLGGTVRQGGNNNFQLNLLNELAPCGNHKHK